RLEQFEAELAPVFFLRAALRGRSTRVAKSPPRVLENHRANARSARGIGVNRCGNQETRDAESRLSGSGLSRGPHRQATGIPAAFSHLAENVQKTKRYLPCQSQALSGEVLAPAYSQDTSLSRWRASSEYAPVATPVRGPCCLF